MIEAVVARAEEAPLRAPALITPYFDRPWRIAAGYPERSQVPHHQLAWTQPVPEYAPPLYESARLAEQDRTKVPGGWADPAHVSKEEFHLWSKAGYMRSYEGPIMHDPETGRPRNPLGRTGIEGRGALGKWGPNHAADALLTRVSAETGLLEILLIQRRSGEWAIPGGMVDSGEEPLDAAYRELVEESGVSLDATTPRLVYQGMGDGPRNTDNAWIETSAYHFHLSSESDTARAAPVAGSDAQGAQWTVITPALIASLYANHGELLLMALAQSRAAGLSLPHEAQVQLAQLPHVPLLTSFSSLSGRIGIVGGSFDPIHDGHIAIAERVAARHNLDAVVFVPNGHNPLKSRQASASPRERVEMVYHAIKDKPGMFVCPMEARAPGSSYTVETLERIRSEVAENVAELFFIVGADCLDHLCQWRDVSKLPMLAQIVPVARPGARDLGSDSTLGEELAQALGEEAVAALRTNRVAGVSLPISSTQIRMQLATQEASGAPLPDTVLRYIEDRGLYRS